MTKAVNWIDYPINESICKEPTLRYCTLSEYTQQKKILVEPIKPTKYFFEN